MNGDTDLPALLELAKQIVPTGFLPDHIKTPGQAIAIILAGRELGMPPMRSLRSLSMVRGKIVENADSQLERFKAAGGKSDFKTLTATEAVLWLQHPNGDQHTESFTLEQAQKAGLVRPGSVWTTHPKAMLRSRAISAGLKSIGWGVGTYTPDERDEITGREPLPPRLVEEPQPLLAQQPDEPAPAITEQVAPAPTPDAGRNDLRDGWEEAVIARVQTKSVASGGGTWYGLTLHTIHGEEVKVSTFDRNLGVEAQILAERKDSRIFYWRPEIDKKGREHKRLIAIEPIEPALIDRDEDLRYEGEQDGSD